MDNTNLEKYMKAAEQGEIIIGRSEYDSYIETMARIDVLKGYIEKESFPNMDVVRIMLGIDKTS